MMFLLLVFKGFLLGCTAIIPGISIGTIALVLNVYIPALDNFTLLLNPKQWTWANILKLSKFFLPLAIGLVTAMISLATLLSLLLEKYPVFIHLSFLGIILGSLPYIYKTHIHAHISTSHILYLALGVLVILFFAFSELIFPEITKNSISSLEVNTLTFSLGTLFLAIIMGTLSSACGLAPGISGSFMLLIFGYYAKYLLIIKSLYFPLLIPLLVGHVIGFILTAAGIKFLLNKFPAQSYNTILGMIIGSAIGVFPWNIIQDMYLQGTPLQTMRYIIIALLCLGGGIALSQVGTQVGTRAGTPEKKSTA